MANAATVVATVLENLDCPTPVSQLRVSIDTANSDFLAYTPESGRSLYLKGIVFSEADAVNLTFKQRSAALAGTVESVKGSLTLTVNATTNVVTASAAHGLTDGQRVRLENSGGALPGGLDSSTTYYVRVIDTTTFYLHPSAEDSVNPEFTADDTTDVVTTGASHSLVTGDSVSFWSEGTLPAGLSAGVIYYVNVTGAATFKAYDTSVHAIAGGATGLVNITDTGTGTHYLGSIVDITSTGTGTHGFNGKIIFGTGTDFSSDYAPGQEILIENGDKLTVASVESATQMTASAEATNTVFGEMHQMQDRLLQLELTTFQGMLSRVSNGWIMATREGYSLVLNASAAISDMLLHLQEGLNS